MIVKVKSLDDAEFTTYDCDDFEFRGNQVTNWVRLFKDGKEVGFVNRVAVFKHIKDGE